jgi:hypothetical protein
MSFTFSDLVEEVRLLPVEEMTELRSVIDRELIYSRRDEIHANHLEGVELWKQGKLTPSSDADEILNRLLNDE